MARAASDRRFGPSGRGSDEEELTGKHWRWTVLSSLPTTPRGFHRGAGGSRIGLQLALDVNVLPEDIAEAVLHFVSSARSGKSTGNILNVDGGVSAAYPR